MSPSITAADLGEDLVNALVAAGVQTSNRLNARVSIAIVDAGGHLAGFLRMEGVHTATVEVAQAKARSAAAFRRSTRMFATQLAEGNLSMLAVPGCVPLAGGIPLTLAQKLMGAVGVSGASPDVDEAIAEAVYKQLHSSLANEI